MIVSGPEWGSLNLNYSELVEIKIVRGYTNLPRPESQCKPQSHLSIDRNR